MNIRYVICFFSFLFIIGNARGQVTIGAGIEPDPSAVLDLQSNDKYGLLLPRVVLSDTLLSSPLVAHVKGMSVYNTSASTDGKVKEGIYWNDGRRWWHLTSLDPATIDAWYTTGNTGTDSLKNFLGTKDNKPLVFKVDNTRAGYLSSIDGFTNYTSFGYKALSGGNTGEANVAFGFQALLNNTTGAGNSAFGMNALAGNITGGNNTAVGNRALANSTGNSNTALGSLTLTQNTTGAGNTAVGQTALSANQTGSDNTAVGVMAMVNTTSGGNTAVGANSLGDNKSGGDNTAVGYYSLKTLGTGTNPAGNRNTAIGHSAGSLLTRGNNNIFIGAGTSVRDSIDNQMNIGNAIFGNEMTGTLGTPTGNIGIGTNTPTARLHVNANNGPVRFEKLQEKNNVPNQQSLLIDSVTGNIYRVPLGDLATSIAGAIGNSAWEVHGNRGTTPASNYVGTADSVGLSIRTNATERMRVTSNGRVGIGTSTPTSRLHVNAANGPVRFESLQRMISVPNLQRLAIDSVTGDIYRMPNGISAWNVTGNSGTDTLRNFIGTTDNNGLNIRTNGINRIHISKDRYTTNIQNLASNGGVGILSPGATIGLNPTSSLVVDGSFAGRITTVTSSYIIPHTDYNITLKNGDSHTDARRVTFTLPGRNGGGGNFPGREYYIKNASDIDTINIVTANGEYIRFGSTFNKAGSRTLAPGNFVRIVATDVNDDSGVSWDWDFVGTVTPPNTKNITYVRTTSSPINGNTPTNSITTMGNLQVRYNGNSTSTAGYIEIRTINNVQSHYSWVFQKTGNGAPGTLEYYGQNPGSTTTSWTQLTLLRSNDGSSSGTAVNFNPGQRDFAVLTVALHNTKEIYRCTFNANGDIGVNGSIPAAVSAVTIFIEQLQ